MRFQNFIAHLDECLYETGAIINFENDKRILLEEVKINLTNCLNFLKNIKYIEKTV